MTYKVIAQLRARTPEEAVKLARKGFVFEVVEIPEPKSRIRASRYRIFTDGPNSKNSPQTVVL